MFKCKRNYFKMVKIERFLNEFIVNRYYEYGKTFRKGHNNF